MSGIVSGLSKTFRAVGSAVTRVGKAVAGVGAATFTAGAASGAGSIASGGLAAATRSGGVLGSILTGAVKQAAVGAIIGGGIGALTGQGFGKGALVGGLGGAVTGGIAGAARGNGLAAGVDMGSGLVSADTATGFAPTGVTSDMPTRRVSSAFDVTAGNGLAQAATPAAAAAPAAGGGNGLLGFLGTETGGNVLAGLGEGAMGYFESRQADRRQRLQAEEYDKQRAFDLEKEMRVRDSYAVDPSVLHTAPAPDTTVRPTPAEAYGRTRRVFDPELGRIVAVPA